MAYLILDGCCEDTHKHLSRIGIAVQGKMGPDQERISRVGLEWVDLLLRKNSDYGSGIWQVPLVSPTTAPAEAILVRMSDKINRLVRLANHAAAETDESFEDTVRDLGAYCLLYLARPRGGLA